MFRRVAQMTVIGLCLLVVIPSVNAGPKVEWGEDSWMQLSFLGQPHFKYEDDAADQEDFYLRRGRIILQGQIIDGVKFFVETDNDNAGRSGAAASSTDIQDAWIDLRIAGSHWIQGGLILLPFSFENRSSAASLLGIDYNAETIQFVNNFVWRDYGVELHGMLGEKIGYRIGAFDGYDAPGSTKNPDAGLRVTGRIDLGVVGKAPGGWFYSQNHLGKDQYLTIGAGIDMQPDATVSPATRDVTITLPDGAGVPTAVAGSQAATPMVQDSENWVVDLQSSFNMGEAAALLLNAAYYDWDNSRFEGNTAFVETGLLLNGKIMPTFKYALRDPAEGDDVTDYTAGLHYFIKGQNARAGVEYRWGDSNDQALVGLQFLL